MLAGMLSVLLVAGLIGAGVYVATDDPDPAPAAEPAPEPVAEAPREAPAPLPKVARRDLGSFLSAWIYDETTPPMPGHPDWTVDPAEETLAGAPPRHRR